MLNNSSESGHPCLIPDLRGNAFSFSPLTVMFQWLCHIWPLLCWGRFPLCPLSKEFFKNDKWMLNFIKSFFSSIEMIIWFLFFILLIWSITSIDLWILKNPCIPGINPTWSWCMILSLYCWNWFVSILLRIFAYRGPSVILACNFLFWWYPCQLLVSVCWWPNRM